MIIDRLMTERGYAVNATLVVAHPSDEALWFGGLLVSVPFQWTVLCCSIPPNDPMRAWKFSRACGYLGAQPVLMPFIEATPFDILSEHVVECLDEVLPESDLIVTHSPTGEDHDHHKQLSTYLGARFRDKTAFGSYGARKEGSFPVQLREAEFLRKIEAVHKYNHYAAAGDVMTYGEGLMSRHAPEFDLSRETYSGAD